MALGGAFWGFFFGLIFFVPFLGAGAAASLSTSLENEDIDEEFIKRVDEEVVSELTRQYDFEIIWTDLPEDELRKLREVFGVQISSSELVKLR